MEGELEAMDIELAALHPVHCCRIGLGPVKPKPMGKRWNLRRDFEAGEKSSSFI